MKLTLEPTSQIVEVNGVPARVWEGADDNGTPVTVFITRVAVSVDHPGHEAFQRALQETRAPMTMWPSRMVL